MKNSKEMADAVFRIRDEYIEKKHRRNEAVKRAAMIGVPAFTAFALLIGIGTAFDRQEIGTDGMSHIETAPVTSAVTSAETPEGAAVETNKLKDTATETKKETKSETLPAADGASPETLISEGEISEGQPEIIMTPTVTEQTTVTTTVTTTSDLSDSGIEGEVFQPDEETDAIPETVNEAAIDRLGDVYIDGIYYLQTFTVTEPLTSDSYLGSGADFEGYYAGDTSVSFYTAKERDDVVIVEFNDGRRIILKRTER